MLYQDDTNAPEVSYYLYDGSTLTAEANASGDITRQYVYLEGHKPIAMLAGNETYAIHTDHIGAPRQMSNARGEIVWRADYTAFGKATLHESNSISLNLRFPGQYADEETGTYPFYSLFKPHKLINKHLLSTEHGYLQFSGDYVKSVSQSSSLTRAVPSARQYRRILV